MTGTSCMQSSALQWLVNHIKLSFLFMYCSTASVEKKKKKKVCPLFKIQRHWRALRRVSRERSLFVFKTATQIKQRQEKTNPAFQSQVITQNTAMEYSECWYEKCDTHRLTERGGISRLLCSLVVLFDIAFLHSSWFCYITPLWCKKSLYFTREICIWNLNREHGGNVMCCFFSPRTSLQKAQVA